MSLKEHLTKRERIAKHRLDNAWSEISASKNGRLVLLDILSWAGIYRDPFSIDVGVMGNLVGAQNIGRRVIARLDEVSPVVYPGMVLAQAKENQGDRKPTEEDESEDG